MTKISRSIALTLVTAFLVLPMYACGTKQDKTNAEATSSSKPDAAKPVTLKWLVMGDKYKDTERVIAEYNKKLQPILPATTVDFELISAAEYKQKWDLKMAAAEKIDLAWTGYLFSYFSEVQKGSYKSLDELYAKYGADMKKEIPQSLLDKQVVNGKLYSVPNNQQAWFRGNAIRVPKKLADKYADVNKIGLVNRSSMYTTKECYDAFEPYLSKLKENNQIQLGISTQTVRWIADKGTEGLNGETSPFVFKYFDKDIKVYNKYESDAYKTLYSVFSDWYKKGYIRKDILSIQNPRADDAKENGTVLWVHGYMSGSSQRESEGNGFPVIIEPLDGYKYISFDAFSTATAIPRTSENPDRAMQLLNVMNSKLGQDPYKTLCYGFEGEHYKKTADNVVEQLKDENNKIKYTLPSWIVGNTFNNFESFNGANKMINDYNNKCLSSPLTGFKLDTSSISAEMAQVDALVKEYNEPLSTGALSDWDKKYAEFIDKMKKAGSDKIVAEMQKQIDAFVKANEKTVQDRQKAYQDGWKNLQSSSDKYIYSGFYVDPR